MKKSPTPALLVAWALACFISNSPYASPTIYLAEMSDAERAFVEKQNARKEEMRKRYFSPDARAKLQAEMADKNNRGAVTPGTSINADPSIAKAKAAGVDTKVFGVPLGEPLSLPLCASANEQKRELQSYDPYSGLPRPSKNFDPLGALRGVQTSVTCQSNGAVMAFMGAILGGKGADRYIMLSKDSCPNWAYCEVAATLHEGNLAGVAVMILAGAGEDTVGKQLRAKYGKPTRKETAQYQNEYGARYEVDELEWVLPGLHVEYRPGPKGGGVVAIVTETGYKALKEKETVQEAQQPKL